MPTGQAPPHPLPSPPVIPQAPPAATSPAVTAHLTSPPAPGILQGTWASAGQWLTGPEGFSRPGPSPKHLGLLSPLIPKQSPYRWEAKALGTCFCSRDGAPVRARGLSCLLWCWEPACSRHGDRGPVPSICGTSVSPGTGRYDSPHLPPDLWVLHCPLTTTLQAPQDPTLSRASQTGHFPVLSRGAPPPESCPVP